LEFAARAHGLMAVIPRMCPDLVTNRGGIDSNAGTKMTHSKAQEFARKSKLLLLLIGFATATTATPLMAADADGDGIDDSVDLDDDNDGILDVNEGADETDNLTDSGVDGALDTGNVTFGIASTGPSVQSTPHLLDSITVSGVNVLMDGVYEDLFTPDSVTTDFFVSTSSRVRVVENGATQADVFTDAAYDSVATLAFSDNNLQHFQLLDGSNFESSSYTLFYDTPIVSNAGGFIAFTERGSNNPLQAEAFDADGTSLGSIDLSTADYIDTGHAANNAQSIGIAMYAIDDIAPVGGLISSIRVSLLGNTNDGPDGKVFIYGDVERLTTGVDTDGDGVFDHVDLDSDNDGIPDLLENGATAAQLAADTNGDGVISVEEATVASGSNADVDNDGLFDIFDANPTDASEAASVGNVAVDSDNDTINDYQDLDSDNDGLTDSFEAGGTDANGDGVIDGFTDTNGDGWNDATESTPLAVSDFDNDGRANHVDLDSDNDGLTDSYEAGGTDATSDGVIDGFADADGNGLDDATTAAALPAPDSDGDGNPAYLDVDSDNDGRHGF